MKTYLPSLTILSLALMSLVTYSFTTAQWTNPPANPPNDNVEAPINVGSVDQTKNAGLGVNALAVFGDSRVIGTTTSDRTHSRLYCDQNGNNCSQALPSQSGNAGSFLTTDGNNLSWSAGGGGLGGGSGAFFNARGGVRTGSHDVQRAWAVVTNYADIIVEGGTFSAGVFTPAVSGIYLVFMSGTANRCRNGEDADMRILKNGSIIAATRSSGSPTGSQSETNQHATTILIDLLSGDTLSFRTRESCNYDTTIKYFNNISAGAVLIMPL